MIMVLHRGSLGNDYSVPRILGYYIKKIISIVLNKIQISYLVDKNLFFGEHMSK